jgi:antitoxin component YwqK of YwqJK toxin-antitoxin module
MNLFNNLRMIRIFFLSLILLSNFLFAQTKSKKHIEYFEKNKKNGIQSISYIDKQGEFDGEFNAFYENGQLKILSFFNHGIQISRNEGWYENGQIRWKVFYNLKGEDEGGCYEWFPRGQIKSEGNYKAGVKIASWKYWDEKGILLKEEIYDENGQLKETKITETQELKKD